MGDRGLRGAVGGIFQDRSFRARHAFRRDVRAHHAGEAGDRNRAAAFVLRRHRRGGVVPSSCELANTSGASFLGRCGCYPRLARDESHRRPPGAMADRESCSCWVAIHLYRRKRAATKRKHARGCRRGVLAGSRRWWPTPPARCGDHQSRLAVVDAIHSRASRG